MNKFEAERAWWSCFWDPMVRLGGKLVTYGPYAQDGVLAPESNQQVQNLILISRQWRNFPVCWDFILQFDLNLRSRDPSWGIRDITELKEVGAAQGLNLDQVLKHNFPHEELTQDNPNHQVIEMPANNKTLVFVKKAPGRLWSRQLQLQVCLFVLLSFKIYWDLIYSQHYKWQIILLGMKYFIS